MERRVNGTASISVRVRYSEVDRMGFLYHVNYLEYFEIARSDWVRRFWRPYKEIEDEGYSLVVLEAYIKFIHSAYYDDILKIEATISDWGHSRIKFNYAIYREGETDPLCTGNTSHCFIDQSGKVTRMPEELREKLETILR